VVELIRGLTTATPSWGLLVHVAYLLGLTALALSVASRRMARKLLK